MMSKTKTKTKTKTIDLSGLPEEQTKLIIEFVDYLKVRAAQQRRLIEEENKRIDETQTIKFRSWPLGVKGKLTRREIYDYL